MQLVLPWVVTTKIILTYNIAQFMPRYETSVVAESPRFKKVLRGSKSGMRLGQSRGGCDQMKRPTQRLRCRDAAAVPRKWPRQVARQLRQDGTDDKSSIHSNRLHTFVVDAEYWSQPFHLVACMCSMSKQAHTGRSHLSSLRRHWTMDQSQARSSAQM